MTRPIPILAAAAALAWPPGAPAQSLQECRRIADAPARLACYDRLPLAGSGPAGPAPQAVAPTSPAKAPAEAFGLEHRQPPGSALDSIQSTIPGRFEGWRGNTRIRLANGQVWQIADDSSRFLDLENPRVTIRRGAMGAFFLDFEGDNRSPRVRRVQ